MREFEFVERIKGKAMESTEGAYCKLPERSTVNSAGYDFYNPETVVLEPGEIKYVKTGVKAYMESGEMLMLCNRSSNPKKKGLVLVNGVGIVDADYADNEENEGEIAFAFMNITKEPVVIEAGDKLGQGIFVKFGITDDDKAEGERVGGFRKYRSVGYMRFLYNSKTRILRDMFYLNKVGGIITHEPVQLTELEGKLLMLLSDQEIHTYEEICKFVYKEEKKYNKLRTENMRERHLKNRLTERISPYKEIQIINKNGIGVIIKSKEGIYIT